MKKKIPDLCREYDIYMKDVLTGKGFVYGHPPIPSTAYTKCLNDCETHLLTTKIQLMKQQNKIYFENKARELLDRRKTDNLSLAFANLLFKSLNLRIENFLNSPLKKGELEGSLLIGGTDDNSKKPFAV